jgi:predicted ATP-grasp superfamily ATP-dependent carboligase
MAAERIDGGVGGIIVGGDYLGLGVARSLGRHGVPVCVIDDEDSICRLSRYVTHSRVVPTLRDERAAVDSVLKVGRELGLRGWILYPTRDELVAAFSRYRDELSEFFRVVTPDWDTVQWIWDKRNTYRLANELGIPTPKTWYFRDVAELQQVTTDPPFVVKPAIKEHFMYKVGVKAWRADTRDELRDLYFEASSHVEQGEVMVQDMIPGDGSQQYAYCAFFKNGRAHGSMVVNRLRQHPREFGKASTFVETIDLPVIEELSERFLRKIDYYGLIELEYKLDPRDGQYRLLDVNGRTWGYHTLGLAAGVDFPYLVYADQIQKQMPEVRGRIGVRWVRLITDVPTAAMAILKGREKFLPYLRSLLGFNIESVFSWDDLYPGMAELCLMPYTHLRKALAKLSRSR